MVMFNSVDEASTGNNCIQPPHPWFVAKNDRLYSNYPYPMPAKCTVHLEYYQVREPDPRANENREGEPATDVEAPAFEKDVLSVKLLRLADDLYRLVAAHCFYYDSVKALMDDHKLDFRPNTVYGLSLTSDWLRQQDDAVVEALDDIRTWVRESEEG